MMRRKINEETTDPEMTQMIELIDKDIIITTFCYVQRVERCTSMLSRNVEDIFKKSNKALRAKKRMK